MAGATRVSWLAGHFPGSGTPPGPTPPGPGAFDVGGAFIVLIRFDGSLVSTASGLVVGLDFPPQPMAIRNRLAARRVVNCFISKNPQFRSSL
jgi:hypothetical protein